MAYTLVPIPEDKISQRLKSGWGINAATLTQLYLGTGRDTGTFRADAADGRYFLRLARTVSENGIAVSLLLSKLGIPAVAPILSSTGNAWESVEGYLMVVYPLIDGEPIVTEKLTPLDWRSVGSGLRAVHEVLPPPALKSSLHWDKAMFVPGGEDLLARIDAALSDARSLADSFQQELARVWAQQGAFPSEFFRFVQAQGQAALATSPLCCLCHGDFQAQNILKSAPGMVHFIDWEGTVWGPPEKDLSFIAPEYRSQLEKGYGPLRLNEAVMRYQICNWLLLDVLDCAERLLFKPGIGTEERQWALELTVSVLPRMRAAFSSYRA